MTNKSKLTATVIFLLKTLFLFGLAGLFSSWLASVWPIYAEWFKKGAVAAMLIPWIWWAAVPALQAFGIRSVDRR